MLEVLQFIFSSFWTWLGSVILITSLVSAVTAIIATLGRR